MRLQEGDERRNAPLSPVKRRAREAQPRPTCGDKVSYCTTEHLDASAPDFRLDDNVFVSKVGDGVCCSPSDAPCCAPIEPVWNGRALKQRDEAWERSGVGYPLLVSSLDGEKPDGKARLLLDIVPGGKRWG